jgi:uncharacterized membrane protein (DUF106 family)
MGIISFALKYKSIIIAIAIGLIILSASFFIHDYNKKRIQIKELKVQLQDCQALNQKLVNEIKLSQERYQQKVNELMKLASKPPQKIEIPVVVEKPIPITSEECQKMGYMIDEFIKIQKESK